jgi:anti-sigma regulatory factor (Ser/Thr protein kinase)
MDIRAAGRLRASGITQRATILGSITIPGRPEHVSSARAFIARTLAELPGVDCDAATLLTSELVTNAIQHTDSGGPGGTVTVVVIGVPGGVLVEVVDDGSAGTPVVKGELYASDGHGLFLVQQLAAQWGYLRDPPGGTTVWFHLTTADSLDDADACPDPLNGYLAATAVAACTASSTPEQMPATSSSQVT